MLPAFEYRSPLSVEEALELLAKYREDVKVLAGGHSLIPAMKQGEVCPKVLLDLRRMAGLSAIDPFEDGGLRIGALVTHRDLEISELARGRSPLLAEVASQVGDAQVRNFGTLVGSVCQADPASDYPAALLALEAQVVVASPRGERSVPVEGFIQGAFETALEPDELVLAIDVPRSWARTAAYVRVRHVASGFALAGVAAQILVEDGRIASARIGVTGVAERAFRLAVIEEQLLGREPLPGAFAEMIRGVALGREILSDGAASAEYRSHLADVCTARALRKAISRIGV